MSEPLDPNGLDGIAISTQAHSVEILMKARVILGTDLKPETIFFEAQNASVKMPGFAFPYIRNGALVTVIFAAVQVVRAEPTVAGPERKIIMPGSH